MSWPSLRKRGGFIIDGGLVRQTHANPRFPLDAFIERIHCLHSYATIRYTVMTDEEEERRRMKIKSDIINDILQEEDLYKILGAWRRASPSDLRRCYLERAKLIHPDKLPYHELSTSAFQRICLAFEILQNPTTRHTYDNTTSRHPKATLLPDRTFFLTPSKTFQTAVLTILNDSLTGDFAITRRHLHNLSRDYPHLLTPSFIVNVESAFIKIRELVLTTRTYALIIYIELGRIVRVTHRLNQLAWTDVVGRTKLTVHLVRVTLAVPVRVDRALRAREERAWREEEEKLKREGQQVKNSGPGRAGILNERICKVLEFMVGSAGKDEGADEAWSARMAGEAR